MACTNISDFKTLFPYQTYMIVKIDKIKCLEVSSNSTNTVEQTNVIKARFCIKKINQVFNLESSIAV